MNKYFKIFNTTADRDTYEQSVNYDEPYFAAGKQNNTASYNKHNNGKYFITYTDEEQHLNDFNINNDFVEIEYLQSTGTQYIDTGYKPNANTKLHIEFSISAYNTNIAQATAPFGVRVAWQQNQYVLFCPVNNTTSSYACYGNTNLRNTSSTISLNQKYVCDVDKNTWTLKQSNGTNIISTTFDTTEINNLWLFKYNNNNTMPGGDDKLNIYKCTISENGVLIHDFIPVHVGNTGYMYDRVTRGLYGNSGTGDFVLGTDV